MTTTFDLDEQLSNLTVAPISHGNDKLGFQFIQLQRGPSAGVNLLTLNCNNRSVKILPTRGMGIWTASADGVRFGWDSPVAGPVHPAWVPIAEPGGLGWLDGFDETVVRCGLSNNGAPEFDSSGRLIWPLHGRIANLPAHQVCVQIDESEQRISVTGIVTEARFHFYRWELKTTISMHRDSDEIEIVDVITNRSDRTGSIQLLYHCNFGSPILDAGSRFLAPVKRIAPRNDHAAQGIDDWNVYAAPDANYAEQVYFLELQADQSGCVPTMLVNADQTLGAMVRYENKTLPHFSLWKNTVGINDGYVTGLEPATNFPNPRSFEEQHGRVVELARAASTEMRLNIGMLVGAEKVQKAIQQIDSLSPANPEIIRQPLSEWSAS